MLIQFDVSVADAVGELVGYLRHHLSRLVHEVVVDEPLSNEFLRELSLWLALEEFLVVSFSIEISAGVGGVDFVDDPDEHSA